MVDVHLSLPLSISVSLYCSLSTTTLSFLPSFCPSIRLLVCLSLCLSVRLSICLSHADTVFILISADLFCSWAGCGCASLAPNPLWLDNYRLASSHAVVVWAALILLLRSFRLLLPFSSNTVRIGWMERIRSVEIIRICFLKYIFYAKYATFLAH